MESEWKSNGHIYDHGNYSIWETDKFADSCVSPISKVLFTGKLTDLVRLELFWQNFKIWGLFRQDPPEETAQMFLFLVGNMYTLKEKKKYIVYLSNDIHVHVIKSGE